MVLGRTFGLVSNLHRSNLTFNQDTRTWYLIDLEQYEDVTTERFPRMWTNVCNRMCPAGNGWSMVVQNCQRLKKELFHNKHHDQFMPTAM